jgi:hypothetical protein
LKNFAACCLEWNLIENSINAALVICLSIPGSLRLEVASRINGIEGKVAIIKAALKKHLGFAEPDYVCFVDVFGRALRFKKYRDGIAHSRPIYAGQQIAPTVMNQGDLYETLISTEHLGIFYEHLVALYGELRIVIITIQAMQRAAKRGRTPGVRGEIEAIVRDGIAQVRSHQQTHKSLPPLPRFPQESPVSPSGGGPEGPQK